MVDKIANTATAMVRKIFESVLAVSYNNKDYCIWSSTLDGMWVEALQPGGSSKFYYAIYIMSFNVFVSLGGFTAS